VFAVSASGVDGSGGVFKQAIASNGAPGERHQLASLSPDTGASALLIDGASNVYVAQALANKVTVFDRDGHHLADLPADDNPAVTSPRGLSLQSASLLVTSQPSDGGPAQIVTLSKVGQP
jgi:hypothetical protein